MDEFIDIENDFEEKIKKQSEALLQIINSKLKKDSDDMEEFDLEKELEKIKGLKPNKAGHGRS